MAKFQPRRPPPSTHLIQQVATQEARKLRAQRRANRALWQGLGLFGLIGWAIVVPTLLGVLCGQWLDHHHPAHHSWTLTLLILGLCLGCWHAWYWIGVEKRKIHAGERT